MNSPDFAELHARQQANHLDIIGRLAPSNSSTLIGRFPCIRAGTRQRTVEWPDVARIAATLEEPEADYAMVSRLARPTGPLLAGAGPNQ